MIRKRPDLRSIVPEISALRGYSGNPAKKISNIQDFFSRSTLTIQQCGVTVEQTIVFASCRSDASRSTIRRSAISQNVPWELEDNQTKNCPHREKNLKLNIHDH
ncbi:uncharacterized protein LOC105735063 isoform X2 [Apis florea]|uniref:uncharacterized protein LOC105735063 isoform X2 n=1 Tax=Apis florea TaxID=7463 RepID=UPI0006291B4B|nr:uncharacterized protein LOC105735063 isoform X2 [Apis florea]